MFCKPVLGHKNNISDVIKLIFLAHLHVEQVKVHQVCLIYIAPPHL